MEQVTITVERYRTPKGEPTCCGKFTEGHFCRFLGRRNFGAEWVCMFGEAKQLFERDGYLYPHPDCEIWREIR